MTVAHLALLGMQLNGLLDAGRYGTITIDKVKDELDRGNIFAFLKEQFGDDIDLSLNNAQVRSEIVEQWRDMSRAVNERRKLFVGNDGLCLLVAYCFEGIQRL